MCESKGSQGLLVADGVEVGAGMEESENVIRKRLLTTAQGQEMQER